MRISLVFIFYCGSERVWTNKQDCDDYHSHSLALSLLGDVADGGTFFADDGAHILGWHKQTERYISVLMLGGHPRARRALSGVDTGTVSRAATVVRAALGVCVQAFIGYVGHAQSVVLKLVAIQLLDSSETSK